MENQRDSEFPPLKSPSGVVSPINVSDFAGRRRYSSVLLDPHASNSSNSPSSLMKYRRSGNTVATDDSSSMFITPVKVEEDVIIMDGFPVPESNKGGGEVRRRLPMTSSDSVTGSFTGGSWNSISSSSGGGGRGSGSDNSKYYKKRLCRFWDNTGTCKFGSECQFAHGIEELIPLRPKAKKKIEIVNLNNRLEGSGSSSYGTNVPPITQFKAASESEAKEESLSAAAGTEGEAISLPSATRGMAFPTSPIQVKQPSGSTISSSTIPNATLPKSDWTPQDDGIEVSLPGATEGTEEKNPSTEDVDAHIEKALYGTNSGNRLPVFKEICPD